MRAGLQRLRADGGLSLSDPAYDTATACAVEVLAVDVAAGGRPWGGRSLAPVMEAIHLRGGMMADGVDRAIAHAVFTEVFDR